MSSWSLPASASRIVPMWFITPPFSVLTRFGIFGGITFHILHYLIWLRITDEESMPECSYGTFGLIFHCKVVYQSTLKYVFLISTTW